MSNSKEDEVEKELDELWAQLDQLDEEIRLLKMVLEVPVQRTRVVETIPNKNLNN
jgi:hypothetical protein